MYLKMIVLLLALMAVASASEPVGGTTEADMNDKSVQDALKFAVAHYNKKSNDLYVRKVLQVIRAQQQLVSGMNYIFTVKLGSTNCRKGNAVPLCSIHKDPRLARVIKCTIVVYTQYWTNTIKVTKNTCLKITRY